MTIRVDKHGQLLGIGDLVRLPSAEEGVVQGFSVRSGRERVVVRYERSELGDVTLLLQLVERLNWERIHIGRREGARRRRARRAPKHPCGESHYRARLSDEEVREMRELHRRAGKGYHLLATIFGCGISTARDICTFRTRRGAS